MTTQHYSIFKTAAGFCGIGWNEIGITRFHLPERDPDKTERSMQRRAPDATPGTPPPAVAATVEAAKRYFAGEQVDFSAVKLDLSGVDALFGSIYAATRELGYGQTSTYGTLAKQLGHGPEVAKDVGQAMAKNPVPLIIPCHRVLAAGGKPGGFSAPGGVTTKMRMLDMEGVRVAPPAPTQPSLF